VKYEATHRFDCDFARLDARSRGLFMDAVRSLNAAYEEYVSKGERGVPNWPKHLRVSHLTDAPGILELTWSFSGPDGRATFQFVDVSGKPAIRWRRIGGHEIFKNP
jgi:hypothetical protein